MAQSIEELSFKLNIDPVPVLQALSQILGAFNAIKTSVDALNASVLQLIQNMNNLNNPNPQLPPAPNPPTTPPGTPPTTPPGTPPTTPPGTTPPNTTPPGTTPPGNPPSRPPRPVNPDRIDGQTRRWINKIKRLVMPLIALFGARAVWKGYMQGVKQIEQYSDSLKMNAAELSKWAKANEAAGGSQKAFMDAMQKWTQKTGKSGDEFIDMMLSLNSKTKEQQKEFLKLNGISEEAAAIFKLHDDEIVHTLQVMKEIAYTDKDIANVKEFNRQWNTFKILAQGIGEVLMRFVVPAFTAVLKFLNQIQMMIIEHKKLMMLLAAVATVAIGNVFVSQMMAGAGAGGLLTKVLMGLTAGVRKFSLALFASPLTWFLAAIMLIILAVEDLMVFARGGDSLFGELLQDFGLSKEEINDIRKEFQEVGAAFSETWGLIKQGFAYLMGYSKNAEIGLKEFLIAPLKLLVLVVAGAIKAIKWLGDMYGFVFAWIAHKIEMVPEYFEKAVNWIVEKWTAFCSALQEIWDSFVNWIKETFNKIGQFFVDAWGVIDNAIQTTGQFIQKWVIDPLLKVLDLINSAKNAAGNYVDNFIQGGKDIMGGIGDFGSWLIGGDPAGSKLPGTVSTPVNTETNNNTTNNNNVNATITINNPADSGKAFQDKYGQLLLAPGLTGMTTK